MDLSIRVWEVASGRERARFTGHAGFVVATAFSPDGTRLVTGGTDCTALVWDLSGLGTADRPIGDFTRADADRLWADLGDRDPAKAFQAMKVLRANSTPAVSLLKERVSPVPAFDATRIARLLADLDRDDSAVRASATKELSELGDRAEAALRAALEDKPPLEKRRRLEDLLHQLDTSVSPELLRGVRAVEVLESLSTPESRQVLRTLAQGAAEARVTREAKAALERGRGKEELMRNKEEKSRGHSGLGSHECPLFPPCSINSPTQQPPLHIPCCFRSRASGASFGSSSE
jgi:hypothetical protein